MFIKNIKSIVGVFLVIFFLTSLFLPNIVRTALSSGQFSYWSFNEGSGNIARDYSGHGYDGILKGEPTWTVGKLGNGLYFDGVDDRVFVDGDFVSSGPFTLCMWLKVSSFPYENIFFKGGLILHSAINGRFGFSSNGIWSVLSDTNAVIPNEWNHICATKTASGLVNLYKNGVLTGLANQSSGLPDIKSSDIFIGSDNNEKGLFTGLIDEVYVYNRVLTVSEILEIYNDTGGKLETPLSKSETVFDKISKSETVFDKILHSLKSIKSPYGVVTIITLAFITLCFALVKRNRNHRNNSNL